jgi:ATP-dependent Zn protease
MRVKKVIYDNSEMLHKLALRLVERETMNAAEVRSLLNIPAPNAQVERLESKS